MSLITTAATFDDESEYNNNIINKKKQNRQSHNKTQKLHNDITFNAAKVNSVLESIHGKNAEDGDDNTSNYGPAHEQYAPLSPLPPPTSVGTTERLKHTVSEPMANINPASTPQAMGNYDMELQELQNNFMTKEQTQQYYTQLSPKYDNHNQHTQNNHSSRSTDTNDAVINKLNYMINLDNGKNKITEK